MLSGIRLFAGGETPFGLGAGDEVLTALSILGAWILVLSGIYAVYKSGRGVPPPPPAEIKPPAPPPPPVADNPPDDDSASGSGEPQQPGLPIEMDPVNYVPWDSRRTWALKLFHAYTPWRGHRDLYFALQHMDIVKEFLGDDPERIATMRDSAKFMFELHEEAKLLSWRIENERHRKYADRSQVRKSVVNRMAERLSQATDGYNYYRGLFPQGPEYDSIQGYIQHRLLQTDDE